MPTLMHLRLVALPLALIALAAPTVLGEDGAFDREHRDVFRPLLLDRAGHPQIAVRVHAIGYGGPLHEHRLEAELGGAHPVGAPIEAAMLALWHAMEAGDLAAIEQLYDVPAAADARFASGMAPVVAMHHGAKHEVVQKALLGDYVIVTEVTHHDGRDFPFEEVLKRTPSGYRFTADLAPSSFPRTVFEAVAERQAYDGAGPGDVAGLKIVPVNVHAGADGATAGLGAASPTSMDFAVVAPLATPVPLSAYAGDDAAIAFLKAVRQQYHDQASIAAINALWLTDYDESFTGDRPVDFYGWYGTDIDAVVLTELGTPQGTLLICRRPTQGAAAFAAFISDAGGSLHMATELIDADAATTHVAPHDQLNRLLRFSQAMMAVLTAP